MGIKRWSIELLAIYMFPLCKISKIFLTIKHLSLITGASAIHSRHNTYQDGLHGAQAVHLQPIENALTHIWAIKI